MFYIISIKKHCATCLVFDNQIPINDTLNAFFVRANLKNCFLYLKHKLIHAFTTNCYL